MPAEERMQHGLPGGGAAAHPVSSQFVRSVSPPSVPSSLPLFGGTVPERPAGLSDGAWVMMRALLQHAEQSDSLASSLGELADKRRSPLGGRNSSSDFS